MRGARYGVYLVTGRRRYRGHEPGTTFEAQLERGAELRAIERGDIRLVHRVTPAVPPDSYAFPAGWLPGEESTAHRGAEMAPHSFRGRRK